MESLGGDLLRRVFSFVGDIEVSSRAAAGLASKNVRNAVRDAVEIMPPLRGRPKRLVSLLPPGTRVVFTSAGPRVKPELVEFTPAKRSQRVERDLERQAKRRKQSKLTPNSHYRMLGLDRSASQADVRRAYRQMALTTHPDKPGGSAEAFRKVSQAFVILHDPQRRAVYDLQCGREGGAPDGNRKQRGINATGQGRYYAMVGWRLVKIISSTTLDIGLAIEWHIALSKMVMRAEQLALKDTALDENALRKAIAWAYQEPEAAQLRMVFSFEFKAGCARTSRAYARFMTPSTVDVETLFQQRRRLQQLAKAGAQGAKLKSEKASMANVLRTARQRGSERGAALLAMLQRELARRQPAAPPALHDFWKLRVTVSRPWTGRFRLESKQPCGTTLAKALHSALLEAARQQWRGRLGKLALAMLFRLESILHPVRELPSAGPPYRRLRGKQQVRPRDKRPAVSAVVVKVLRPVLQSNGT
mmetsp:Transcript_137507/g.293894  ORF Transcript_137507/g.293894 Transcript_137507/m.293894 type:complete len:474 (+) Transcript_137507:107-1528(+)